MSVLDTINITIGDDNKFIPNPIDRSQTEVFSSMRSRHFPLSAFYVPVLYGSVTWQVNGYEVSATKDDNVCITDWAAFSITLQQPTPPSQLVLDTIKDITIDTTEIDEEQLDITVEKLAETLHKVVINITKTENSVSPISAMINLFGNSERFTEYTDALNELELLFDIKTMGTGLEKHATKIEEVEVPETEPIEDIEEPSEPISEQTDDTSDSPKLYHLGIILIVLLSIF